MRERVCVCVFEREREKRRRYMYAKVEKKRNEGMEIVSIIWSIKNKSLDVENLLKCELHA